MTAILSVGRLLAPGVVALLAFAAPEGDTTQKDKSPHTKDSLATVQERLKEKKAVLIDVREKAEWEDGHLEEARLLPLSELGKKLREKEYVAELKKSLPADRPIYLHCKAGGHCVLAADALRKELGPGFDLRPLKPGFEELVQAGFTKAAAPSAAK